MYVRIVGRVVVFDRVIEAETDAAMLVVGDTLDVVRGNGPREGERMGTAEIVDFDDDGNPVIEIQFGAEL